MARRASCSARSLGASASAASRARTVGSALMSAVPIADSSVGPVAMGGVFIDLMRGAIAVCQALKRLSTLSILVAATIGQRRQAMRGKNVALSRQLAHYTDAAPHGLGRCLWCGESPPVPSARGRARCEALGGSEARCGAGAAPHGSRATPGAAFFPARFFFVADRLSVFAARRAASR